MPTNSGINIVELKKLINTNKRIADALNAQIKSVEVIASTDLDVNDISKGIQTNDVKITLDSEVVAVDATGQGDVPITLDGEAVVLTTGTAEIGNVKISDGTDQADVETMSDDDHDIDGLKALVVAGQLYGRIDADTVKPLRIDASTHSLQVVDNEHHEIHAGNHFTYTQVDADFDIADAVELLIVTPNTTKWAHMVIHVSAELDTNIKLYEGATHTVLAAQTVHNNNRNSATANTTTINTHNDDGADGTLIFEDQFGISTGGGAAGTFSGGVTRGDIEFVLKQNEKYLLVVTSGSDNSSLSIRLSWYEHTDKN